MRQCISKLMPSLASGGREPMMRAMPAGYLVFRIFLMVIAMGMVMNFSAMAQIPPSKVPPPAVFEPASAPTARGAELEKKTIKALPLSSTAVGTLLPASGQWNSFVTVSGPEFAKAERVTVIWFPDDDASQPQAGRITATLRSRSGANQIQVEMPRDAGGAQGGVVRVYLTMPGQLQLVLAGRFSVQLGSASVPPFAPVALATAPFRMTGVRIPAFQPVTIEVAPFKMTGVRLPAFLPVTIQVAAFKMTGVRAPDFQPVTIQTAPLQMTGQRLRQMPTNNKVPLTDLQPAR